MQFFKIHQCSVCLSFFADDVGCFNIVIDGLFFFCFSVLLYRMNFNGMVCISYRGRPGQGAFFCCAKKKADVAKQH